MSEPRTEHPDSERLLAFAEGRLLDCRGIEEHLDECEACAEAVLIARQIACLSERQLIPALTPVECDREKDRLRRIFKREPLQPSTTDLGEKPTVKRGGATWASLGAIAAGLSLSHGASSPTPSLAGSDSDVLPALVPPAEHQDSPASGTDHDRSAADTEQSERTGVIPGHDPASSHQKGRSAESQELSQFLELVEKMLGTDLSPSTDANTAMHGGSEHDAGAGATADPSHLVGPESHEALGEEWAGDHGTDVDHAADAVHGHDELSKPDHDDPHLDSTHDDDPHHDSTHDDEPQHDE